MNLEVVWGYRMYELEMLYSDPYIAKVGHDHRPAGFIDHPRAQYYSAYVDGEFAGAFLAIRVSAIELDVHSLLKREFVRQSRELGKMFFRECFSDREIQRITAKVIDGFQCALNYCLKLGFTYEGAMRGAIYQSGVPKSVHILGMLRGEKEWAQ
jgi:hypothetical protein